MNLILKADVKAISGNTRQAVGALREGMPTTIETLPDPHHVCIAQEEDGFYLLHFNAAGESFADTWHVSLDAAKKQASFEFGIVESDWKRA